MQQLLLLVSTDFQPQVYSSVNIADSEQADITPLHYANMPMQYTAIFHCNKNDKFQVKNLDIFLIFAQNIDCGYT